MTAVKDTESNNGNNGVSWVGGQKAGGYGQAPIRVTSDVVKAGYNLLHNRSVEDTSAVGSNCQNGAICQAWGAPTRPLSGPHVCSVRPKWRPVMTARRCASARVQVSRH